MSKSFADSVTCFARAALATLAAQQRAAGTYRGDDLDRGDRVAFEAATRSLAATAPTTSCDRLDDAWEALMSDAACLLLERLNLDDSERLVVTFASALEIEQRLGPMVACLTDVPTLRHPTVTLLDDVGRLLGWPRHTVRRSFADHRRLAQLRLIRSAAGSSGSVGDSVVHPAEWVLDGIVDGGTAPRPVDRRLLWLRGASTAPEAAPVGPLLCTDPDVASDAAAWADEAGLGTVAMLDLTDDDDDVAWNESDIVIAAARQCLAERGGLLVETAAHHRRARASCEAIADLGVPVALHDPQASHFPLPQGWRHLRTRRPVRLRTGGDPDVAWSTLSRLATRVDTSARWSDLVVAPRTERHLRDVVAAIANHSTVMETWGFGRRPGSVGISVLCNGPSGTGKTLAGRVLAAETGLDLWMVDLARVTDKYLGESEKQLDRVLTAAASCGAMLLFDEAESLFGRRGETHEARDRWANLEVAYLLQRIEQHPGVIVLTTNLGQQLDDAFDRRIAHRVEFAAPDESLRLRLWGEMFADVAPLADRTDLTVLAHHFELSGGAIRSAAVNAAYSAAADVESVIRLEHLVRAAVRELTKAGAPPTRAELGTLADFIDESTGATA